MAGPFVGATSPSSTNAAAMTVAAQSSAALIITALTTLGVVDGVIRAEHAVDLLPRELQPAHRIRHRASLPS
jgi:hypothetical protein